jgi:electron transport complex, RnfABCDGE type, E subunit
MKKYALKELSSPVVDGMLINNPTFRLVLGTCPTLAVTTTAVDGLTMGIATAVVLILSNVCISALRTVIPDKVRIPSYILLISVIVTVLQRFMAAYLPGLNESLGIFIPLIVVNCIILARAEAYAAANPVILSALDGVGVGLGFTLSLGIISIVREVVGSGTIFGAQIPGLYENSMTIFALPAGGFMVYGFLMAAFNTIFNKIEGKNNKKVKEESASCHTL